jgi:hypothetical protein
MAAGAWLLLASPLVATPINYGDFSGTHVSFLQVTEDSATDPTPLWGAPTVAGDGLTFSPTAAFHASASGGSTDLTDGKLNTTFVANDPSTGAIHNVMIHEGGDYTLAGSGTSATTASVAAPVFLTLTEVNGAAVSPVALFAGNLTFAPSGGTYDLVNDPGIGVVWTGALMVNIDALLAANGINGRATRIEYQMDNTLVATSESGTISFIEKKNGFVSLHANVPEPSTLTLALVGSLGLAWQIRRRRGK